MTSHSPSAAAYAHRLRPAGPARDRTRPGRPWRVWDLDAELRYVPVVDALPATDLPICEVGSGPRGIAVWTGHSVIGVDPGADEEHGDAAPPPNMRRVAGDGAAIPLADGTAGATIAVDTFEHIPREVRGTVVAEMARVTAPGGRVIAMGPTGAPAAGGDRRVLDRWRQRDGRSEHRPLDRRARGARTSHRRRADGAHGRERPGRRPRARRVQPSPLVHDAPGAPRRLPAAPGRLTGSTISRGCRSRPSRGTFDAVRTTATSSRATFAGPDAARR